MVTIRKGMAIIKGWRKKTEQTEKKKSSEKSQGKGKGGRGRLQQDLRHLEIKIGKTHYQLRGEKRDKTYGGKRGLISLSRRGPCH